MATSTAARTETSPSFVEGGRRVADALGALHRFDADVEHARCVGCGRQRVHGPFAPVASMPKVRRFGGDGGTLGLRQISPLEVPAQHLIQRLALVAHEASGSSARRLGEWDFELLELRVEVARGQLLLELCVGVARVSFAAVPEPQEHCGSLLIRDDVEDSVARLWTTFEASNRMKLGPKVRSAVGVVLRIRDDVVDHRTDDLQHNDLGAPWLRRLEQSPPVQGRLQNGRDANVVLV